MTTLEIIVMSLAYLVVLVATAYFARATARRVMGALAGGAVVGLLALGVMAMGKEVGWWRMPFAPTPYFLALLYLGTIIACSPIYLVTWRLARRFGWRGLALFAGIAVVIGPPRDYLYAATFPRWMVFAPGITPVLADAATYLGIVLVGHAVMRLVAGPAGADRLARG